MTGKVWMSSVQSNAEIGMKQGLRTKFYGHEWNPAEFKIPLQPEEVFKAMNLHSQGYALPREQMPEAGAVWNEKAFCKMADIFAIGGFFAVKGALAEVLSRFDLGGGGLVHLPIYQADLQTSYPGEFFLLNFGARKNTILPECSENVVKFVVDKTSGRQIWKVSAGAKDGDVALSAAALAGPDLWMEEDLDNKIFMSDALAQAISEIGMKDVFRLLECRVLENVR